MSSLKRAAVRGTFWSALSTVSSRGLRFCITIVLARLLVPADFGLFAMSMLVIDIAELLSDLGLGAALIQRKHLEPEHLVTCFWANQMIGVFLWAVTVAAAPAAGAFYHNATVSPVLSVMALIFLIAPIGSVPWVLLNRELKFKELMIAQTIATVVRGSVALTLAWRGFGVWSLVWGPLAGTVTGSIVNWSFCRWRPSVGWSWRHYRELFHFGKGVFGTRFLGYFAANSDNLITGRVLGAATLGIYNFAYQIPHLTETHLAPIVNRVLFPVMSQVQDDLERLRRGYLQSLRWIAMAAMPFAVALFVMAPELIPTVYGQQWQPVVAPLQLLCAAGLAHALTSLVWTVTQAAGRSDIGFWWNAATVPFVIVALIFSARWGITGIATTMLVQSVVLSLAIQHVMNRLIRLPWACWYGAVRVPALAAAGMGCLMALCRAALLAHAWSAPMVLAITAAIGVVSYAGLLVLLDRHLIQEARSLMALRRPSAPLAEPTSLTPEIIA